uniref:nucleotidyltransferase domain-containing protein n=1 Tax=Agathobacter rectalis TaxID=39491 RepID=UPI004028DC88
MSDRNRILCEFRNKTKSIMGDSLKQMILYGSYARGDYGDNSDMDIMVLTELTDDRIIQIEDEIFDAAYDIELEYGVPISVNIKNEKHFKNWVNSLPYYSNMQKEGIIIASKEEAQKQFDNAESIVAAIIEYMRKNNSGTII